MAVPGVFLDRDGTVIEDVNYLSSLDAIKWIEGAKEAIKLLKNRGYKVIMVTNQSGVARGIFDEHFVHLVHRRLDLDLKGHHTQIDAFYYCPHHPDTGTPQYRKKCQCRKPSPGLILKAAKEHGIDLERSFFIGDNVVDVEAALNAKVRPILVLTGKGQQAKKELENVAQIQKEIATFPSILEAARWIIRQDNPLI